MLRRRTELCLFVGVGALVTLALGQAASIVIQAEAVAVAKAAAENPPGIDPETERRIMAELAEVRRMIAELEQLKAEAAR